MTKETYQVGDTVHYRGDKLPNRLWNISNIGDQFMTIKTDTMDGLSRDQSIKVVTDIDIYKTDNYHFDNNLQYDNSLQIKDTMQEHVSQNKGIKPIENDQTNPTIHFAPVIINGGDASQIPSASSSSIAKNIIPDVVPEDNIQMKSDIAETQHEDTKSSSSNDNIFTNNFLIKKLMQ